MSPKHLFGYEKHCRLNLYFNQETDLNNLKIINNMKNYPYKLPNQVVNEANFTSIEDQVERVDYDFYDNEANGFYS